MTEQEWLACAEPNVLLQWVGTFPQTERKWICAMQAFSDHSLGKPDHCALELMETMAQYADGIITRQQVADHFETAMRGDGVDVTFNYGETCLYLGEAVRSGAKPQFLAATIHDIFGNTFRPIILNPVWRTRYLTILATAAYNERSLPSGELDPARLAVLADALEEAGCHDADILAHCRSKGPHVRGCWALDLILDMQ